MARIDLTAARREATFVALLEGCPVTPSTLTIAIRRTISRYGARRCAEIVATEYGDHPEVAVPRMNRAKSLVAAGYPGPLLGGHGHRVPAGSTPAARCAPRLVA